MGASSTKKKGEILKTKIGAYSQMLMRPICPRQAKNNRPEGITEVMEVTDVTRNPPVSPVTQPTRAGAGAGRKPPCQANHNPKGSPPMTNLNAVLRARRGAQPAQEQASVWRLPI
jgi:hypothetical protein